MAEGRSRGDWDRFSALMAVVANSRWGVKKAISPKDFNPYHRAAAGEKKLTVGVDALRVFVPQKNSKR